RAGSRHPLPGQSRRRTVAEGRHPRGARPTAGWSTGDAQAHAPGEGQPLRRIRRSPQGGASGGTVRRIFPEGRKRAVAEESRCRGELLAGAARGVVRPAVLRAVQRCARRIHSAHLRGVEHMKAVKLAPSILAADFARLGEQVVKADEAGADRIHVDVMDGHFVPNLSMGPAVVDSLRRVTHLPLEAHLMISDPDLYLDEFAAAGADSFLVHWEGNNNLHRTVQRIRALDKRAGVAINPATPAAVLEE